MTRFFRKPVEKNTRRGAATVEFAVTIPVFALFLVALIEFGHAYMVQTTLRAAAKKAARMGVANGVTTDEVSSEAMKIVSSAVRTDNLTVLIKDANIFDTSDAPTENLNITNLPDIALQDAETRHLFIVRLELPYDEVALFPPFWVNNLTLHSQSVMRHE
ncbi:TadE/TadG family type IV pilus assembly protein [Rubinisphaera margarita]|uniref:TadE/TadG family type IV pilus assembly protein n=1 Tax=Rubinisphaera margarita TaxID=2909586 RepID=UPI001EE915C1|nr:TadE/TadG family type IV pilus assembly protein [Rubinisphaera margarita]MCG6156062.1 pilus assembly protein [Rubinisphaera margarita]